MLIGIVAGLMAGFFSGYYVHKQYVRYLGRIERAARRRIRSQ